MTTPNSAKCWMLMTSTWRVVKQRADGDASDEVPEYRAQAETGCDGYCQHSRHQEEESKEQESVHVQSSATDGQSVEVDYIRTRTGGSEIVAIVPNGFEQCVDSH